MTETSKQTSFDLSSAFDDMFSFERDLDDLADIAVPRAADAMAEAFEQAGERIEDALERAARTGEVSFENLIATIASDLARLGAGAVIDQIVTGIGGAIGAGPPVSINVTMPEGADAGSLISAQGQIASALSQAVLSGARWS